MKVWCLDGVPIFPLPPKPKHFDGDCDEIRKQIGLYLATNTQASLLKALDVNSNSLSRFMAMKGPTEGQNIETYAAAYRYFAEHPQASKKAPVEEKMSLKQEIEALDLDEDAMQATMEKWNCNKVRKRITLFLASSGWTQTEFLKFIGVNSNSFQRFMSYKKPMQGADNNTFRSGVMFFIKLDMIEKGKKKKPKKRARDEDEE